MGRIVIISNRVSDAGKTVQAGGVAVALSEVIARRGGTWAGWDGRVVPDDASVKVIKRRRLQSSIVTTPLSNEEHHGFYLGYSNSVLWPVFHNRLDLAQFEAGYFQTYQRVNARFARMIAPLLLPDDLIWVHDYQFILLGAELRKLGIGNPIGFFLHIPFPPAQSFLSIPEYRELAEAFSAYELVGLQTQADVANMLASMQQVEGRLLPDGRIRAFDRIMAIESQPIGIDASDFAVSGDARPMQLGRPGATHIVGIDRLDYTKGLPQKFRAYGRFLERWPQYRRKVVLTQIAPPTRESVEAYTDIRKELESLSGSINGRFGELDWVPIHYIHRSVARNRLGEIYRASAIGLITPLRDGMNLVAKEYVAAQLPDDPGVLILSRFAGAAEKMDAALIINPYDIDDIAKAIQAAIEMSLEERQQRYAALIDSVRHNDVKAWSESFVGLLERMAGEKNNPLPLPLGLLQPDRGGEAPPPGAQRSVKTPATLR